MANGIVENLTSSVSYPSVQTVFNAKLTGNTHKSSYSPEYEKQQTAQNSIMEIARKYEIKKKHIGKLRSVSQAFRDARNITLTQECQMVQDGIRHMSGMNSTDEQAKSGIYMRTNNQQANQVTMPGVWQQYYDATSDATILKRY